METNGLSTNRSCLNVSLFFLFVSFKSKVKSVCFEHNYIIFNGFLLLNIYSVDCFRVIHPIRYTVRFYMNPIVLLCIIYFWTVGTPVW